jgi:hypothetical protein
MQAVKAGNGVCLEYNFKRKINGLGKSLREKQERKEGKKNCVHVIKILLIKYLN